MNTHIASTRADTSGNGAGGIIADIAIIISVIAVATLGALVTGGESDPWYAELQKSVLTPPGTVFAVVWPILYVLMTISAIIVRRTAYLSDKPHERNKAMGLFFLQLALNLGWSILFFFFHRPSWAMLDLVALLITTLAMAYSFEKISSITPIFLIPYIGWLCFAGYLNGTIIYLNM